MDEDDDEEEEYVSDGDVEDVEENSLDLENKKSQLGTYSVFGFENPLDEEGVPRTS